MTLYTITAYTYKQAKKLGLTVKPSTNKTKKIDVYKQGKKIASVGANGMNDYPTFMKKNGLRFAKTRRAPQQAMRQRRLQPRGCGTVLMTS